PFPSISATTTAPACSTRSHTATVAPARANVSAVCRPIPFAPPVITATRPCSSIPIESRSLSTLGRCQPQPSQRWRYPSAGRPLVPRLVRFQDTAGLLRWEVWRAKPSKKHLVLHLVRAALLPEPPAKKTRLRGHPPPHPPLP